MRQYFPVVFLVLATLPFAGHAQNVRIKGRVIYGDDPSFNLLVVNKSTAKGHFGNKDGTFEITAGKGDTVLVGALGYETHKITMADSVLKDSYRVKIYLRKLSINLREVQVFPRRDLDSIQQDIRELGYDERDYILTGIDAMSSPLTYLYQQVSKKEQQKRRAYEIINEDRKRDLLKELFVQYVDHDIINLKTEEFEDFIDFMNVSDSQLIGMSQYDFVVFTKEKYRQFRQVPPRLRQDINTHD